MGQSTDDIVDAMMEKLNLLPQVEDLKMPSEHVPEQEGGLTEENFNRQMEIISRYAEDVVKTWFAQINNKAVKELFGDGLIGHVASIRLMPDKNLIADRRALRSKAEEGRGVGDNDGPLPEDGWELKLMVADANHRTNLAEWKAKEPALLPQMMTLLRMAQGFIMYALEKYQLPHAELFVDKIIPSPWGTLYIFGANEAPQIGINIECCTAVKVAAEARAAAAAEPMSL